MKTAEARATASRQRTGAWIRGKGCKDYSDCLTCPFPKCREEVDHSTFARWAMERKLQKPLS